MIGPVAAVAEKVPGCCHVTHCNKDRCRISLEGAPSKRVIVDMDCATLPIPGNQKRCDYLFVGEEHTAAWVAPMEFKSGRFSVSAAMEQLEGGARAADTWLPSSVSFQFVPILAHGKPIHRKDLKALRSRKPQLRGQKKIIELIRCGDPLTAVLGA